MSEQKSGRLVLVRDAAVRAADHSRSEPEVGQIRLACPDRGAEVPVLVVEVHDEHVHAMLCGRECGWATDTDSVLEPLTTGLPRPILVHGDVSGAILKRRLGRTVGRQLGPSLVERIVLRGRGLDYNSSDLGRGRAMTGESDPRWDWKLEKHRQLRQLRARASELGWQIHKLSPREE